MKKSNGAHGDHGAPGAPLLFFIPNPSQGGPGEAEFDIHPCFPSEHFCTSVKPAAGSAADTFFQMFCICLCVLGQNQKFDRKCSKIYILAIRNLSNAEKSYINHIFDVFHVFDVFFMYINVFNISIIYSLYIIYKKLIDSMLD